LLKYRSSCPRLGGNLTKVWWSYLLGKTWSEVRRPYLDVVTLLLLRI
jgi:hypothetical protein